MQQQDHTVEVAKAVAQSFIYVRDLFGAFFYIFVQFEIFTNLKDPFSNLYFSSSTQAAQPCMINYAKENKVRSEMPHTKGLHPLVSQCSSGEFWSDVVGIH